MKDYLKGPGKHLKLQIDGTRVDEFNRDEKSNTFEINGVQVSRMEMTHFFKNGLFGLDFLCPIYDWSANDVFEYHKLNSIPLSTEYMGDKDYLEWAM
jgi:3'-phosphoadenosine 5'-phosphosulfate sulfotransferase (PAPS reductase)/FAD synthetase